MAGFINWVPSESDEQICLFEWAEVMKGQIPELRLLFHIPNGGYRNKVTAARMKAEGVKAGDAGSVSASGTARGAWAFHRDEEAEGREGPGGTVCLGEGTAVRGISVQCLLRCGRGGADDL